MSRDLGDNWWFIILAIIIVAAILGNKYIDRKYPEPPEEGVPAAITYFPTMDFEDDQFGPATIKIANVQGIKDYVVFTVTVTNSEVQDYTFNYSVPSLSITQSAEYAAKKQFQSGGNE